MADLVHFPGLLVDIVDEEWARETLPDDGASKVFAGAEAVILAQSEGKALQRVISVSLCYGRCVPPSQPQSHARRAG